MKMKVILIERPIGALRTGTIYVNSEKMEKWVNSNIGEVYSSFYKMLEGGAGENGIVFLTDCVFGGMYTQLKNTFKQKEPNEIQKLFLNKDTKISLKIFINSLRNININTLNEIMESLRKYSEEVGFKFNGFTQFINTSPQEIIIPAIYMGFYTGFQYATENPEEIVLKKFFENYIQ